MMKNLYEIFDEFEKASTKQDKIDILRNNSSYALTITNIPYYKPSDSPPGLSYSSIHQELGRTYIFEKNNPKVSPNLSDKRKEHILIQILECLEEREAQIYMNMLLKKQRVKGLTSNVVKEAFPDLLP